MKPFLQMMAGGNADSGSEEKWWKMGDLFLTYAQILLY